MKQRKETRITVRFPSELIDELRTYTEQDDRSLNAEIVQAVREFLAHKRAAATKNEQEKRTNVSATSTRS